MAHQDRFTSISRRFGCAHVRPAALRPSADVFTKIRKDFDTACVVQSDEETLRVMKEFMLQAAMARCMAGKKI